MPKGIFTRGMAILLSKAVPLEAIAERLGDFRIAKRIEAGADAFLPGSSLLVAYRPEVNGYVSLEVVDQCWPDQLGDPKADHKLFAAWGMGYFGPAAWPGGLERACEYSYGFPKDRLVPQHQAFVRILCRYVRWQAFVVDEGLASPPREVLRWFPQDQASVPAELRRGITS